MAETMREYHEPHMEKPGNRTLSIQTRRIAGFLAAAALLGASFSLSAQTAEAPAGEPSEPPRTQAQLTLNDLRIEVQPYGSFNEFVMFEGGGVASVAARTARRRPQPAWSWPQRGFAAAALVAGLMLGLHFGAPGDVTFLFLDMGGSVNIQVNGFGTVIEAPDFPSLGTFGVAPGVTGETGLGEVLETDDRSVDIEVDDGLGNLTGVLNNAIGVDVFDLLQVATGILGRHVEVH